MYSLHEQEDKIRLWFDPGYDHLLDLRGGPLAIIKDGLVFDLRSRHVAYWKSGRVLDVDGRVLLKRGHRRDGPARKPFPLFPALGNQADRRPVNKPWLHAIGFIKTLRFASFDYSCVG